MGKKRFLGKGTAFDVLLAIMLGSILGRAINGSGPLFETIGAVIVLVSLHWLFAVGAFHSARFRQLVEGTPRPLIQDGEVQAAIMHKSRISDDDLLEALRRQGLTDPQAVHVAYLERSGEISIIPRKSDE